MKKKFLIAEIIILAILIFAGRFNVYASGVISLSGSKNISVGSTGTITVSLLNGYTGKVSVESSNPGVVRITSENQIWCEPSSKITISGVSEGTATITAKCVLVSDSVGDNESYDTATINVTVKVASSSSSTSDSKEIEKNLPTESTKKTTDTSNKSRNNYLSSIKISDGTLSPEFNRETTEYTINFDDENTIKNLDKIKITATAEDKKSKVTGTGEKALTEGDNKFSIKVTSESGDTRTYVINVTKPVALKESDLKLSSLKVQTVDIDGNYSDANLENTFDSNVYEYTLNVESNISSLNIDAVPENENIDVSITGNEALHEGMNEVIITLTSKDDNTIQTTYKIVVNKAQSELLINASDNESLQNDNFARKNRKFIFTIGILTIILIALLIIWYKKSKKRLNNKEKIEKNLNHNLIDDDDIIIDKDNEEYNEIKQKNVDDANVKNDTKEFDEKFNVSTKPKRKGGKHF